MVRQSTIASSAAEATSRTQARPEEAGQRSTLRVYSQRIAGAASDPEDHRAYFRRFLTACKSPLAGLSSDFTPAAEDDLGGKGEG